MYQTDDLSSPVGALDTICLFAFIGELFLRVEYYSWWTGPHAVLRNPWALLDLYLVVSHGVTTTAAVGGFGGTKTYGVHSVACAAERGGGGGRRCSFYFFAIARPFETYRVTYIFV